MHNHSDGASDLAVSFDAFTITRWERALGKRPFTPETRWHVTALYPWSSAMLADPRALSIANKHHATMLVGPDSGSLPNVQFAYGLGFRVRKDAIDFLADLERAARGCR